MITPEDKVRIKEDLTAWCEVQDRKKELSVEAKALCQDAATLLDTKPAKVSKLFKILKKKMEEAVDELEELSYLQEEMKD